MAQRVAVAVACGIAVGAVGADEGVRHAADEGTARHTPSARAPDARAVQQLALSTLAVHAARVMGDETARMVGLDAVEPVVAIGPAGAYRPAVYHPEEARIRPLPEPPVARGRIDGQRRPRHGDLMALRAPDALGRRLASAYDHLIEEVAREHAVAPHLVRAVIKVESNFEPHARSPKGAVGLMQVMPATGRRFGATDLRDPRTNLGAGTRYLRWLLNRFDEDLTLALAAYNAGEGAVEKYGRRVPPYPETQNYVRKVLMHLDMDPAGGEGGLVEAESPLPPARQPRSDTRSSATLASVAERGAGGTLHRLSGWLGTLLTSGSRAAAAHRAVSDARDGHDGDDGGAGNDMAAQPAITEARPEGGPA